VVAVGSFAPEMIGSFATVVILRSFVEREGNGRKSFATRESATFRLMDEADGQPRLWERLRHEHRLVILALLPALPSLVVAALALGRVPISPPIRWLAIAVLAICWIGGAWLVRAEVARPLQTLANAIASLREGDYTIRVLGARPDDPLGLALLETNMLGELLRVNRLGEMEATALLRTVMAEIDVAIYVLDEADRLQLINRAGERLLAQRGERLLGREAAALQLAPVLTGEVPRVEDFTWPGGSGRWGVRRTRVRQGGRSHTLLVLTDLSRTLREEQLVAWQRIVRVLSHEINNSMTPIQSIAHTLRALVAREPAPPDLAIDVARGLGVIAARSEALGRLMSSYARLAKLPPPNRTDVDVESWVRRTAALETRVTPAVRGGPSSSVWADADQLDQLLINLVHNAADAALETNGAVTLSWSAVEDGVEVCVEDEGPGLSGTANLFVPFYTTKPHGSGIGLVLCRQIAEAHGGTLTLANRSNARGCVALVKIPRGRS
jgi:two-component system, NtrC family, nitrogen regulation sensor histidine kinase NtrY